jgi:2-phosphoglycolate phosphatase
MSLPESLRAVLFDFDGTLADSFAAIAASVNHVRAAHGLPPLEEKDVRQYVGRGMPFLLENTVPGCDQPVDQARYRAHHPSVMRPLTRLLPGAAELLAAFHQRGLKLGVCSNKPSLFTRELLDHLRINHLMSVVLGPEDVPRPKPAPDMLRLAMQRMGVTSEQTLYIGDMVVDIETAALAGVCVWVVTGSQDREALEIAGADRVLGDLNELVSLLLSGRAAKEIKN